VIQPRAMAVSLGLIRGTVAACAILLAGCGGSSGPVTYTVRASVSGLSGSGLILQLNAGNDLALTANGNFTFATPLTSGMSYQVTVKTQPASPQQVCTLGNASGTVGTADINDITVTCVTSIAILYSFTGGGGVTGSIDGAGPNGSLVQGGDGSLYGTTSSGGASILVCTSGCGTVFEITLSGQEMVLHSFGAAAGDGIFPVVGLILGGDGNFYGPTPYRVGSISGSLYQISAAGAESVIYPFPLVDGVDDFPMLSGVIQGSDGLLYGADYEFVVGSGYRYVIYGITTTGLRAFTADIGADLSRQTHLVQTRDGSLYGTTNGGGAYGMGTVFKAKPDVGTIYSFGGLSSDALAPGSPMIQGSDGNLYGTTSTGGSPSATCPQGCGTVFRVTPSGVETVLYSFGTSSADGQGPSGALVQASDGNFYGTTASGGSTASSGSANSNCVSANVNSGYRGCGTIYKITPTGIATVLYSFGSSPEDGTVPTGALLQASDGNLYGTTTAGGAANEGTVFKLILGAN
jgi:uncharacterized repeat protein (TIGR03803 family)